jgi:hypothetical protein
VRQKDRSVARFGVAFDVVARDGANRVKSVVTIPVAHQLSAAWEVETDSGRYLIVVNRSGHPLKVKGHTVNSKLEVLKL